MASDVNTILAISFTQAVIALLLALVFLGFHNVYRRSHLLYWALSFFAGAVHLGCSALALGYSAWVDLIGLPRLVFSAISLAAAYPQVIWLLAGAYVVASHRHLSRRFVNGAVAIGALFGITSSLLFANDPAAADMRLFLRVDLRTLLAAAAFLTAAVFLWNSRGRQAGFGQRLLAVAFLLFGLQQASTLALMTTQRLQDTWNPLFNYVGFVDLVIEVLIGLALVIWLQEEERQRAKQATRKLYHLSFHDALTGLPNRKLFLERLAHAMQRIEGDERLTVAFVNVDRFRLLNESFGHQQADRVLAQISDRLLHRSRSVDTVARIGVDEFALLYRDSREQQGSLVALERMMERIRQPFEMEKRRVVVTCSTGTSRYPDDGQHPETLLANASAAMLAAKQKGGDRLLQYSADMSSQAQERLEFESELRHALANREFTLLYQPIISLVDNQVLGFEALLRWKHPSRGLLAPDDFLPLAESLGLMDRITNWVLETACRQIGDWRRRHELPLWVAVNFSPSSFRHSDLPDRILGTLKRCAIEPESLIVEITENLALENLETGMVALEQMRVRGIQVAIDDFGTGYSSLSYLRRLPVDKIKLDKEFVHEVSHDIGSRAIVEALVPLAHKLGMKVVAEGVERKEQLAQLRDVGCDEVQGFLMYEPMPVATCESMLESIAAARYFSDEVI
ncbi:MAG: EAL domain-containing protein [Gammaproteobacteria bacterium]|nr:EAL domain-containing protein [Gammaproteobacteria bacterium]